MSYIIRTLSDYSFMSSCITIDDMISYCKDSKLNRCFLVDNNLHGAVEFYNKCKANNIKPIIGLNIKVKYNDTFNNLVLIAKNETGFRNISRLSTLSYEYKKDYIEYKQLAMYSQFVIAIINSDDSYIASCIKENKIFEANEYLDGLKGMFKDIYFGIFRYSGISNEFINSFKEYGNHNQIESIISHKANHKNSQDTLVINLLDCIDKNIPANKDFLKDNSKVESYLKGFNELSLIYDKEELENLNKLSSLINLEINKVSYSLPKLFENPNDKIKEISYQELENRNLINRQEYVDRLEYELQVIFKMGFSNYYLIVADYVNHAKQNDIPVGLRGSGAASLVAFLLNISSVDPIKYGLLFERFLNVNRSNYPDFDVDFSDIKREEIIKYVKEKYGIRNVSQIATFNTFGTKGAIRDIAKAIGKSNEQISEITKLIGNSEGSINEIYKSNEKFRSLLDIHSDYKLICSLASSIEKLKKQVGLHAAGILLSSEPIDEIVPCFKNGDDQLAVQYDYSDVESIGLIKMDFLGLKNLTVIDYCLKEINKKYEKEYTIDNYPFDDIKGYELIAKGETLGLFQLDTSDTTRKVSMELNPKSFEDIVALLALIRPGSAPLTKEYIERKDGKEISYTNEKIKEVVGPTYGVLLYQEQVMQLCQVVAGYSLAEADIFRRAISKKKKDVMQQEQTRFVSGCLNNGFSKEQANKLFELIAKFAEYGFNKGHSVSYARLTSLMASLKANYKTIFYESLLNVNKEKEEGRKNIFHEAKKHGIIINKPSVNTSSLHFSSTNNSINFGLSDIQDVSEFLGNIIIEERNAYPFKDLFDFTIRMVRKDMSKQIICNLVYAGALDCFGISKEKIIGNIQALLDYANMFKGLNYENGNYENIISVNPPIMYFEDTDTDFNKKEYEMLGFYLSKHPLETLKENDIDTITNLIDTSEDGTYKVICKISSIELRKGKDNQEYLTLKLEDETSLISIRDYRNYSKYINSIKKNNIIKASIANKNGYYYLNYLEVIK